MIKGVLHVILRGNVRKKLVKLDICIRGVISAQNVILDAGAVLQILIVVMSVLWVVIEILIKIVFVMKDYSVFLQVECVI